MNILLTVVEPIDPLLSIVTSPIGKDGKPKLAHVPPKLTGATLRFAPDWVTVVAAGQLNDVFSSTGTP